jgi:hypothetical protein
MFELYAHNIDPGNSEFQTFIKRYVALKEKRDPESIPYPELYRAIRDGIREYLKKTGEAKGKLKK